MTALPDPAPALRAIALAATALAAFATGPVQAAGPAVAATAAAAKAGPGVAWVPAATDADIERAFTLAKADKKPVLLYWGATWCPPCNQLKATLFNRADFIERTRAVVAVHVDGDLPGAQKLGARFKVRGYPTLILLRADGEEITRLPGEADAEQVMDLLQTGLSGGRSAKAVLADARAGRKLSASEWRMLGFYAWDVDEDQLLPADQRPAVLMALSQAAPATEANVRTRLMLKALADSDDGKGVKPDAAMRERVRALVADPVARRPHLDVLINGADSLVKALAPTAGAERTALVGTFDAALKDAQADTKLSRADRVSALIGRIELARIDQDDKAIAPTLPAALPAEARELAQRLDREITDGYERQAVITAAAYMLGRAGLWKDSDELLKANLARSHSAYYLMSQLGSNARDQGRKDEALRWYEQAFTKSVGPATRLQWGASYLSALVDMSPADAARIERTAAQLFTEAAAQPNAFHERSARSLQRVGRKLTEWSKTGTHDAVLQRLQGQLDGVCGKLDKADPQRATCEGVLRRPAA
jgi:thioredoxin-like negative regulator of GroEL